MSSESSPMLSSQNGKIFLDQENEQLTINDASNNHVALAGKDSTGAIVFKVAKPGFNAITATNDQLIFNSAQNTFKIVSSATIVIPQVVLSGASIGGVSRYTLTHNLGYAPVVIAFLVDINGNTSPVPGFRSPDGEANIYVGTSQVNTILQQNEWITYTTSNSTVVFANYFSNPNNYSGGTYTATAVNIKYYLLQETAI